MSTSNSALPAGLSPVHPAAPVAGYIGGKRNLARRICAIIDSVPHSSYAEPFVGMGGVFLRRSRRPRAEAINDISGDVATLFRCLIEHYPYLVDMMRFRVTSRAVGQYYWLEDENYVLILEEANHVTVLVTAYYVQGWEKKRSKGTPF